MAGGFIKSGTLRVTVPRDMGIVLVERHIAASKNKTILSNIEIMPSPKYSSPKAHVIPPGTYDVVVGDTFGSAGNSFGHYLTFKNAKKEVTFEVTIGVTESGKLDPTTATVNHKTWSSISEYRDFLKYYKVLEEQNYAFSYENEAKSKSSVTVKENSGAKA